MKKWALFVYLCLLFSLLSFQSATAQVRSGCPGKPPKPAVCETTACLSGEWVEVPKHHGTGCKDPQGVAGHCDGVHGECSLPCPDETAFVAPKYYVLSLIYSPPGCTSTSSFSCRGAGEVDYGQGASLATKIEQSSSMAQNTTLSVDTTFKITDFFNIGGGVSVGWSTTSTDTNSQTISRSGTLDIKINGNNDGVDHDQDEFFLLLNPAVAMKASAPNGSSLEGCAPTQTSWQVGLFGSQTLETYHLSVSQLKNPQSMPPNVANVFKAHGFTANDFAKILALDPFAQGQTAIDPVRFAATTFNLPYEPPITGGNCGGGVCSCVEFSETLKNDFQSGVTSALTSNNSVGFNESAGLEKGLFSGTVKITQEFTWSNSSSNENDKGASQSAALTLNCPSPAYTKPTDATQMLVYWDRLFGTFLFVPQLTVASQQAIHQGFLNRAGKPAVHVPVELTVAGKTYHTLTGNSGKFVFYGQGAAVGNGILSVNGKNFQIPLSPTVPAKLEIQ